jgi:uncharacterized membrane protein YdjX (TVP38/TMEM64 family)
VSARLLKIFIVIFVLASFALFFAFRLDRYLTLGSLREHQEWIRHIYSTHPFESLVGYFVAAFLWTVCSLPAATILMLLAGAMFGAWLGTAICVIAMSVGALVSLLISRFLLRSFVQHRFARQAAIVEREYSKNGVSYLIAMRLTPILPYFVANAVFGLTTIPALKFFIISMLATIPVKFIYANAGAELSHVNAISDIFTWQIALAFVALALLPFAGRFVKH